MRNSCKASVRANELTKRSNKEQMDCADGARHPAKLGALQPFLGMSFYIAHYEANKLFL